jgi:4-amino-4-deoxy-L-arabinose transferase-like glycosyltransferase
MASGATSGERDAPALSVELLVAGLVVLVVAGLQWPVRLYGVSPMDEGGVLQVAADMLRGRRLYGDAVMYAFPGVFWLAEFLFARFGATIEVARAAAVVVFAVASGGFYLLARWTFGRPGALGMVGLLLAYRVWAFPHWQMLNYSSIAVTLVLAATWSTGEAVARGRPWLAALAGVLAACATLMKQDLGGAAVIALGVVLLVAGGTARGRLLAAWAASGIVVAAAAIVRLWADGSLAPLVDEAILAPLHGAARFAYAGRPSLFPLVHQDAALRAQLFAYCPPIVLDAYGVAFLQSRLYRATPLVDVALKLAYHLPWLVVIVAALALATPAGRSPRRLALFALAVAALAAFNKPHDWAHLIVLYPVTLLLVAALVAPGVRRTRVRRAVAWSALGAAVVVSAVVARAFVEEFGTPIHGPGGTLYARAGQAVPLQGVLDALAAAPADTPVLSLPYHPLVNFLARRPAATRYYAVWPVELNPHRDDDILADLARRPDTIIVYSVNEVPTFPRMREYAAHLFAALVDRYEIARTFGGEPGGATFLLLAKRLPATRPTTPIGLADVTPVVDVTGVAPPADTRFAAETLWPFTRVLRVATLPASVVALHVARTPAPGDRFQAACGTNPERWGEAFVPAVHFRVIVRSDDDHDDEVASLDVDPLRRAADRRWIPIDVDLTPWAGRRVDLVLRAEGWHGAPIDTNLAGWADPRIVHAP